MEYRKIPNTNLELSVIAFGAWAVGGWMWGSSDRMQAVEAIRSAYQEGVTTIDTAPIYGQGTSEEIVGEAIKGLSRDKIQILTKFGMRWDLAKGVFYFHSQNNEGKAIDIYKYAGKESIIKECEDSLRRLRTDYIDLYQIHWSDESTPIEETFEAVARLIEQGKVRYAGVCNYNLAQLQEASNIIPIASDQIPFSMVRRSMADEIIPYCMENGKGVIAYSPLERGLLTGKMTVGYQFAEGDHRAFNPVFTDENITRVNNFLEKIKPIADRKGCTLSQLVLRWTACYPGITCVLAGARNSKQAVENAHAGNFQLSEQEVLFIDKALGLNDADAEPLLIL